MCFVVERLLALPWNIVTSYLRLEQLRESRPSTYCHMAEDLRGENLACSVLHHCVAFASVVIINLSWTLLLGGHPVAQLVEALRYKPERRGFDSRWCHWDFSLT